MKTESTPVVGQIAAFKKKKKFQDSNNSPKCEIPLHINTQSATSIESRGYFDFLF